MFGGPPSKGKKITCPTRGQASPALRPQNPYQLKTLRPEYSLLPYSRNSNGSL
ncbi:hypothetical protein N7472_005583 [Penicillium cf. griseofulvum]|uniref:Uncharacterized protein n=1 Tax=Penicillium cf. griseofulvum TaxID=2972120 RepID=A0A9W9MFN5_9EURO|nr:hypothetical protein N7472_005583 [Penicillium cf. griseofulvum]